MPNQQSRACSRLPFSLLLWLTLFAGAFAQKRAPLSLREALEQKLIALRLEGAGGHSGGSLIAHVGRLAKRPVEIVVPAGQIFLPADSSTQALINVKEETFALSDQEHSFRLKGRCAEASDGSPGAGEFFRVGEMAAGALLGVAQYISQNRLFDQYDAQAAIWCVTDRMPVGTIHHQGLLSVTCQLLGVPVPDYKVNYEKPATPANRPAARPPANPQRRQPAFRYEPLSVEGAFTYESGKEMILNVYVQDTAGHKVRTIFENQKHPAGSRARYSFYFKTTKLPRGDYEVCLHDGTRVVQKMKVRY